MYELVAVSINFAVRWNNEVHRHLPVTRGGRFAVGVRFGAAVVGVGIVGSPPPAWEGNGVCVVTRCAVLDNLPRVGSHAPPVCTMIYGALARAAKALGYREIWTYTLPGEDGRSLRAAGFRPAGETRGGEWSREGRERAPAVNSEPKGRWFRRLT